MIEWLWWNEWPAHIIYKEGFMCEFALAFSELSGTTWTDTRQEPQWLQSPLPAAARKWKAVIYTDDELSGIQLVGWVWLASITTSREDIFTT